MLLFECVMDFPVCVLVAGFVVSSCDAPEASFESWPPATLALVAMIKANNADEDCTFRKVGAKSAPKCIPLAGLVIYAGDLQQPVPDCKHDAPEIDCGIGNTNVIVSASAMIRVSKRVTRRGFARSFVTPICAGARG
jgi:hypothetical protein